MALHTKQTDCEVFFVDEEKVEAARSRLEHVVALSDLAETFKLLGDATRLKIILALHEQELCVCDLSALLGVSRSAISHQLRPMRNLRLVRSRREGKMVYYSLADSHIREIFDAALEHIEET